jgi:hypothetical protein
MAGAGVTGKRVFHADFGLKIQNVVFCPPE